jgi:high-affinity iron transporter
LRAGLAGVERSLAAGDASAASSTALRLYLDQYETIEAVYGPGGPRAAGSLPELVTAGEAEFHRLMSGGEVTELVAVAKTLRARLDAIETSARSAGIPIDGFELEVAGSLTGDLDPSAARTSEIRTILEELDAARDAYGDGRAEEAKTRVESVYLERVEPLEARLPARTVHRIESLIHLQIRPALARGAPASEVQRSFAMLDAELISADAQLAGGSAWFGVVNSFAIIVREGLEAVLLIGAILAYLSATGAGAVHRRRVFAGVALGVVASFATWAVARTLIPVSGASRELIEGVTALVAVAVLLYVSNWLFQKTYIHDWKQYLREHVGRAVTTGSALAMAGLAFAAVYREGFETVLFYQALLFDAGPGAVLVGFIPGMLLILVVGVLIVRLGVRLPLRSVFGVTNAILVYLAFVFLGKGLYNLQEAGIFAPTPVRWLPDSEALRQIAGLYPVAQTLLAQAALVCGLAGTYVIYRRRAAAPRRVKAASPRVVQQ